MKIIKLFFVFSMLLNVFLLVFIFSGPMSGLDGLKPASGSATYLLSVNERSEPTVYSIKGKRWEVCQEGQCKSVPSDINVDFPYPRGFVLVDIDGPTTGVMKRGTASYGSILVESAYAAVSDGKCPVKIIKTPNNRIIQTYPSSEEDPDCPPH